MSPGGSPEEGCWVIAALSPDEAPMEFYRRVTGDIEARKKAAIEQTTSSLESLNACFDAQIEMMNAWRDAVLLAVRQLKAARDKPNSPED